MHENELITLYFLALILLIYFFNKDNDNKNTKN